MLIQYNILSESNSRLWEVTSRIHTAVRLQLQNNKSHHFKDSRPRQPPRAKSALVRWGVCCYNQLCKGVEEARGLRSQQMWTKTLSHITRRIRVKSKMGKALLLLLLLISSGGRSVFEFQVQQEDLIRFQRKLVEISGHWGRCGVVSSEHESSSINHSLHLTVVQWNLKRALLT